MRFTDKARLLAQVINWRLHWDRRDLEFHPGPGMSDKFITGREAAARIPDGATVISCGMAGNARCSAFFWAVGEHFQANGRPRGLTWLSVGAQGGRGKAPGSVEELGHEGLLKTYISGHVETAKALLDLAENGALEIQVLPQGEMTLLIEGQGSGRDAVRSRTGIGTFLDPRCGRGSTLTPQGAAGLIEADGDELVYHLPPIDVALFSASYADAEGNIYLHDMATLTETHEAIRAAKHNRGLVMAVVASLIEPGQHPVGVPAKDIDAVFVNPWNEQTVGAWQGKPWQLFTPGGDGDDRLAIDKLRFINKFLRITPTRGPVEEVLGRLGARLFADVVPHGSHINIGVGFAEEVCREVCDSDLREHYIFTTETGVYGGVPAPGIYFGAAVNPIRFESSAWMFRFYQENLEASVLGILQVDSEGNVNVSKRGPTIRDYVGPGGLPSIVASARIVIFIGTWMAGARWKLDDGHMVLVRAGKPKFIDKVDEVTFSGPEALASGKQVYYATNVGTFRLTADGLELMWLMPGIDIDRDILANTTARVLIPDSPPAVDHSVVTGQGFDLSRPSTVN
jgi:propionate CoA-transferase